MLYFAYGSNLDPAGMGSRCPAAVPLGRATLPDHRLVFRHWADVAPSPGRAVTGGLWRITTACRAALDLYEGVAEGLYRALTLPVHPEGAGAPPEAAYLAAVLAGWRAFGLDPATVLAAAAEALREG